uniref:S-adenosylmethionine decarboxylase n=1 Tax=viral metagenome TaxID=1070528 RepID=A0A6C0FAI8_9ZZZZ
MSYDFVGKHYIASYLDCSNNSINNITNLKINLELAIKECGATVLNSTEHVFNNNGFTIAYLLSESHCSVHTYPEYKSLFVDLFTCGEYCNWEKFDNIMTNFLQPKNVSKNIILRGEKNIIS